MIKFQHNDAGRSTSRRPKQKYDCVIRSTSLVLGKPYDEIYDLFKEMGRKCSVGTKKELWQDLLNSCPVLTKISFPPVAGQSRMNLNKFCLDYPQGIYIVQMAGHLTTVINGVVHDDFKPREHGCVYAVWKKI